MPTKASFSTKGFNKYLKQLAGLEADIDEAAREALTAGAEVMRAGMVKRVPVDTGNLKAHIKIKGPDSEGGYHIVEVGVLDADAKTARYATVMEYGTSNKGGRSYIRATADEDKRKIRAAIRKVFKEHVKRASGQ